MNEIQKLALQTKYNMGPYNEELISIIIDLLEENTPSVAVDLAYKEAGYLSHMEDVLVNGSIKASQIGLAPVQLSLNLNLAKNYFLFTKFDKGVSLSDTIHSGESQKAVKSVLKDYFKFKGNVTDLTKQIGKVNTANPTLSKTAQDLINEYRREGFASKESINALKKLQKSLVNGSGIMASYNKLIKAIEAGRDIEKAVGYAVKKKAGYINERISRTEIARSYDMSFTRGAHESGATGFQWILSASHPRADICDCYAEADAYGMGKGVYPIDAGARVPAHPNCLCSKTAVYPENKGRYSQERVKKYLDGLSEKKRAQIIGASNSEKKKNYIKGLDKRGFQPDDKANRMISKSVLKEG